MRNASFHRASAIRQQARTGRSVVQLAAAFSLDRITVEKILACRTREAAAAVLDALDPIIAVKCYVHGENGLTDFTNLLQRREI